MDTIAAEALDLMHDAVAETSGHSVTYTRPDVGNCTIYDVVIGKEQVQQLHELDDLVTESDQVDFLIKPASIDFGTGPVEPAAGDQIQLTLTVAGSSTTIRFIVQPSNAGEPVFRPSDPHYTRYRVHTKRA